MDYAKTLLIASALGLLAIAAPLGDLSPAGEASAYCIYISEVDDCVNPCYTAGQLLYTASGGRVTVTLVCPA